MSKLYRIKYIKNIGEAVVASLVLIASILWISTKLVIAESAGVTTGSVQRSVFNFDQIRKFSRNSSNVVTVNDLIFNNVDFKYVCVSGPYSSGIRAVDAVAKRGFDRAALEQAYAEFVRPNFFNSATVSYLLVHADERFYVLKLHENGFRFLDQHEEFCLFDRNDTLSLQGTLR